MMALALAFTTVACSDDDDPVTGGNGGGNKDPKPKSEMLYSFTQKAYTMGQSVELTVELLNRTDASAIIAEEDIPVTLIVDEASTAVEGVDFEIENSTATVLKGSNKCTFTLKTITKSEPEEGEEEEESEEPAEAHNTIVLGLQLEGTNYLPGAFPKATVNIVGSMVSDLYGTWVMNSMNSAEDMNNQGWGMEIFKEEDGYPVFNPNDKFVFDGNKLTTSLESAWKNYFQPESEFTFGKELKVYLGMFEQPTMQLIELKNVNRYFSATEQSEDKVAYIAVRNIETEDGETLLDVHIVDYESHSFALDFMDFGMYGTEKPVANMGGVSINFTLKKAE